MNIRATEKHFSFLASCVTGYKVHVTITNSSQYVGYTSMPTNNEARIVLSAAHPIWRGMDESQVLVMMLGVLAHECLHLTYTPFDLYNQGSIVLGREAEREAFHETGNVTEDPAIEYWASHKIGGKMLKALYTLIKHTWKVSPSIHQNIPAGKEDDFAYTQVIRALIQVGDRGVIKGHFVSDVARKAFAEILPLFNAAVMEPNGEARVEYVEQMFKILRPLIRTEMEQSQNMDKGNPMKLPQGMGEGEPLPGQPNGENSEDSEEENGASVSTDGEAGAEGDKSNALTPAEKRAQMQKDIAEALANKTEWTERPYEASTRDSDDLSGVDEDMTFTEEDMTSLLNEIEATESQMKITENMEATLAAKSVNDYMPDSDDVINIKADNPNEERYNRIVSVYSPRISTLTGEFRKIFSGDREQVVNATHGSRINLKRLVDGRLHSNILLSRRLPKNLDDMAVYLLIDKSGSMSRFGSKNKQNDQAAAETAICLYEALRKLNIPVYVTGFTTRGNKALHVHYVTWNSPHSDKYSLANFSADDANYDYYSIAEASRILKRHNAKYKVLIVISDGAPCNTQRGMSNMDGVAATAAAVTAAKKHTNVLGVALNCFDENIYRTMYGKDYISVKSADDMFVSISSALQRIVKQW